MRKLIFRGVLLGWFLIIGCTDSKLVEQWKNPEVSTFTAQKVLVIAVSNEQQHVAFFEDQLVKQLQRKGINALNSTSFFNDGLPKEPLDTG